MSAGGTEVVSVDVESGQSTTDVKPALEDKDWISALALDKAGNLYLGIRGTHHHVLAYGPDGKQCTHFDLSVRGGKGKFRPVAR